MHSFNFELPITDPIVLFCIGLFIVLIVPILFTRFKLPGILGLIIAGLIIGPNGFNIIEREGSLELLGSIGLMYLMFLAGLELDMLNFEKLRNRSIIFGILTFTIPFALGYVVCYYLLDFEILGSLLIASMFSTHTLVSYPIISRYKIAKLEPVNVTVGGTIITDTIVLLFLIVITSLNSQNLSWDYWVKIIVLIIVYLIILIWIFPIIGKWFFQHAKNDSISQFIFVLFMIFLAGSFALIVGIEPIIGAFLAGISLNKLIPHASLLKNRLEFVGNALFIPFFLVYVGTFIDLSIFLKGFDALKIAIILTIVALVSKLLAAYASQKIFRYKPIYGKLIFGLSSSHAAATIAVIMVGYRIGIVDTNVLNATILIIFASCLISSLITESAAKKIAVDESTLDILHKESNEKILVPIANPASTENLLEFSKYLRTEGTTDPIYVLAVARDENEIKNKSRLLKNATETPIGSFNIEPVTRVDINVASGIIRACKELQISDLVMGWNGKISTKEWIFGSILEQILTDLKQTIFVVSIKHPLNNVEKIKVLVPNLAQFEPGFQNWLKMVCHLSEQITAKINFITSEKNETAFINALKSFGIKTPYELSAIDNWEQFFPLNEKKEHNTFFILIGAREGSISHNSMLNQLPQIASKKLSNNSFSIVYPLHEQATSINTGTWLSID